MNTFAMFNWLDWLIVSVILLSAVLSFTRGFFREALSLVIWIAAALLSFTFYPAMSTLLESYIASPSMRQVAAVGSLFVICLMVGGLFGFLMSQLIKFSGFSTFDRLLGVVFGFFRGIVIVVVVLMVAKKALPVYQETWWMQSILAPHVARMESSVMLLVINIRDMILPFVKNAY